MEFNKHKHRNQTNRNLIIIAVGFLATIMAGAFVFQSYVSTTNTLNKRKVVVIVDNQTTTDYSNYTFTLGKDTSFTKKLVQGKDTSTIKVKTKSKQLVSFSLDNFPLITDSVWVHDSIGYVFVSIKEDSIPKKSPSITIHSTF